MTDDQVSALKSGEATMTCTMTIKRAATGKEETYNLVFSALPDETPTEQPKEQQ